MKNYFRSDLACETSERLKNIDGTDYEKIIMEDCTIERLKILSDEASDKLGRKKGFYVTITSGELWKLSDNGIDEIALILADEIRKAVCKVCNIYDITADLSILVAGLGNSSLTADALGPEVIERLTVTRHMKFIDAQLYNDVGLCSISAIAPSVLGKTGIESAELIKSASNAVSPDAIIVIDALAAGTVDRLGTTIQLSDTGIHPGSGIGNLRNEISKDTMSVPVISLGVPTVVDSSTMVYDALKRAGIEQISSVLTQILENGLGFYVTPKETDVITEKTAILLSRAICNALVISG